MIAGQDSQRTPVIPVTETSPSPPGAEPSFSQTAFEALGSAWLAPISDGSPAGEEARYDRGYEAIREQIAKQSMASANEVDWGLIVKEGEQLLKTRSKDLLVAAYVAWAWYRREQLIGLARGIAVIAGFIDRYWEGLFPSIRRNTRARANAISWLIEKSESVTESGLKADDRQAVELLELGVQKLARLAEERFDDDNRPSIRPFYDLVNRLKQALPPPPAKPAPPKPVESVKPAPVVVIKSAESARPEVAVPTDEPPEQPAEASTSLAPALVALSSEDDLDTFVSDLKSTLREAAATLRAATASHPMAFRFSLLANYLRTIDPPDTDGSVKTIAPAPPADSLGFLQELANEQKWPELLNEAEALLAQFTFSLDAYRYLCVALEQLGPDYEKAHQIAAGELAALLRRVPVLSKLQYADGTPFAKAATVKWLQTQVAAGGAHPAPGAAENESSGAGAQNQALDAARQAAERGEVKQAAQLLQQAIEGARGGRERFQLRLELATICARAQAISLAEALYATLLDQVREQNLELWEPELARACFVSYYDFLTGLAGEDEGIAGKLSVLYQRLCRLDPSWALGESANRAGVRVGAG